MAVLLIADVNEGHLATDAVAGLGEVYVLIAGTGGGAVPAEAATLAGVAKVLFAADHAYCHGMVEATAALLVGLAPPGYSHICGAGTAFNKNVLPQVAALLDVMVISEVTAIIDPETFERPIYAGNAVQTVRSLEAKKVFTVRTAGFTAVGAGGSAPVEKIGGPGENALSAWVEDHVATSGRPELTSASIVVSGGRGVGSKESFDLIEKLADKLNGAVGASRAAVDNGYTPNDWQVGQTGKVVAPNLYIAVGISGAIQHLAGMKDSKVIVAINQDEDAPIFQVADYGIVPGPFTAVQESIEKL